MAEWPNAVVLKTIEPKGSGGSNPSLSANSRLNRRIDGSISFWGAEATVGNGGKDTILRFLYCSIGQAY